MRLSVSRSSVCLMLAAAALMLSACSDGTDSRTQDIFQQDQGSAESGNARRHKATDDERLWTIDMGGCTGHLISPDTMMTANHCSPRKGARYRSGSAISRNAGADITVEAVAEADANLDFAIMKIRWTGDYPKNQKFPPLVATKASDVATSSEPNQGDEIFTVGFPGDKSSTWGATYSEGHLKQLQGTRLAYNMGIINGNSGGGVWLKANKMLVSLTNGGPNILGQGSWNTGSADDPSHWNTGAALWLVYAQSPTLKDIFPNGKNRFAREGDNTTNGVGELFVAIGKGDNAAVDTFVLHATAPNTAKTIFFCQTPKTKDCRADAAGYSETNTKTLINGRAHFEGKAATALEAGLVLSFVAVDADGKTVAAQVVQFAAQ